MAAKQSTEDRELIRELRKRVRGLESEHSDTLKRLAKVEAELTKRERWMQKSLPQLPGIVALSEISPDHAVLDVGTGPGRLTWELVTYLSPKGSYHGLEVQQDLYEDLKRRFGRLPNFHFHHADLVNSEYNPEGEANAENYRFPLDDATIDRVILRSIVTHLVPDEVDNYLAEIARVLRPGGRSYITWFILDDESRPSVARPEGEPPHPLFQVDYGDYWVLSDENPAAAVAFEEQWVRGAYERAGMRILEPIHFGGWSDRPGRFDQRQDVVVAERL
jgi:SAM-dependent methyltransferase